MTHSRRFFSRWPLYTGLVLTLAAAAPRAPAQTAALPPRPLDLATTPILDGTFVAPNVLLTFDDSGSMWQPSDRDDINLGVGCVHLMSPAFNGQTFNPRVTYAPPPKPDGSAFPDVDPHAAPLDVYDPLVYPGAMDLWTSYQVGTFDRNWCAGAPPQPAWYAEYKGSGDVADDRNYDKYTVTGAQMENFKNWFVYYRLRTLALRSAASLALTPLRDGTFRVAYQGLNTGYDRLPVTGSTDPARIPAMQVWGATSRTDMLAHIQGIAPTGSTPTNAAYVRAGRYFEQSGINGPYASVPGRDGTELACRRNYQILFTDGGWNDHRPDFPGMPYANHDGAPLTFPTPDPSVGPARVTSYTPRTADTRLYSNNEPSMTLADIAFYYWSHDLRPDLANRIKPVMGNSTASVAPEWDPANDPATWQHLNTYLIDYGTQGYLDPATDLPRLVDGSASWKPTLTTEIRPAPLPPLQRADVHAAVDDAWHASLNSRGGHYSATSPDALLRAFKDIFEKIGNAGGASSTAAFSTGILTSAGETAYASGYDAEGWVGSLLAFTLDANGTKTATLWDAGCVLTGDGTCASGARATTRPNPAPANRVIVAGNPQGSGVNAAHAFTWSDLTGPEKALLDKDATGAVDHRGQDRLDFIRGVRTQEIAQGGTFRTRRSVLGDVIGSQPVVVGAPQSGYGDNWGTGAPENAAPYSEFASRNQTRDTAIYVGANDGMLHGFDTSGKEIFAYIPRAAWPKLSALTRSPYLHQTYVDATPTARDVFVNGGWKTTLTSSLGTGGRGLFALDVTGPAPTASTAHQRLLWDNTYSNNTTQRDVGYIYTAPYVARLADGHWWAVSGNGYNSPNGKAALVLVRMDTGAIKIIPTPDVTDPMTPPRQNGMAGATLTDFNSDGIVEYAYAGDLYGNLWKFDLRATNTSRWAPVGKQPIVTARAADGSSQSITAPPRLAGARPGGRVVITFGTGKFLEPGDLSTSIGTQSLYGVFDDATGTTPVTRSDLATQTLAAGNDVAGIKVRTLTSNAVGTKKGWVVDLPASGERVILQPALRDGLAFYSTLIPSGDSCNATGSGYVLTIDVGTGGPPSAVVLDLNGDGKLTAADKGNNPNIGGYKSDGVPGPIAIGVNEAGTDVIVIGGTGGMKTILSTTFRPRRVSWRQVH